MGHTMILSPEVSAYELGRVCPARREIMPSQLHERCVSRFNQKSSLIHKLKVASNGSDDYNDYVQ